MLNMKASGSLSLVMRKALTETAKDMTNLNILPVNSTLLYQKDTQKLIVISMFTPRF